MIIDDFSITLTHLTNPTKRLTQIYLRLFLKINPPFYGGSAFQANERGKRFELGRCLAFQILLRQIYYFLANDLHLTSRPSSSCATALPPL